MGLFAKIWRGWSVGVSVLFLPVLLVVSLMADETLDQFMYVIPAVPLIAAFQGFLVAGLVMLGLKIWPLK
ncbi:hypothetical protein ACNKU7_12385 [Microbulbifer sp. SA54]|uniref:hypothetical protein n=1 Tax=Microbulbifer sp. SA54 TaxID=3401577 RepID=UPI003AAD37DD